MKNNFNLLFFFNLFFCLSFFVISCQSERNETTEVVVSEPKIEEDDLQPTQNVIPPTETLPPTSTPDPMAELFLKTVESAKQANDLYIKGEMVRWREIINQLEPDLEDALSIDIDIEALGYSSEDEFVTDLASISLLAANLLYDENDLERAANVFEFAIENAVQASAAYSGRGHVNRQQGQIKAAVEDFNRAIELNPNNADAFRGLAMVSLQEQDISAAQEHIAQALRINPDYSRVYALIGDIYEFEGNIIRAENEYDKALNLDPENRNALYGRARIYAYHTQEYEQCVLDLDKAIELGDRNSWNYELRGECKYKLERYQDASNDFINAIEQNTDSWPVGWAHFFHGEIYYHSGEYTSAIQEYSDAIELIDDRAFFYKYRGDAYVHLGEYEKAIADFTSAIDLDSTTAFAYYGRAYAYDSLGTFQSAYIDYDTFLSLDPSDNPQTRLACDRMNALHFYNAENIFDMFLGTGCDRFPLNSSGYGLVDSSGGCAYGVNPNTGGCLDNFDAAWMAAYPDTIGR